MVGMNSSITKLQHNFFLLIFIGSAFILLLMYQPFLNSLVLAGSFAIVFQPFYLWISRKVAKKESIAALLTVFLVLVLVLLPLLIIGGFLFDEVKNLYISLAIRSDVSPIGLFLENLETHLKSFVPDINLNVPQYVESILRWTVSHLDSFFSSFLGVLLNSIIMVIALFFLLRDGKKFREKLYTLSPLGRQNDENILARLTLAVNSVIKGSLVISVIQGIFTATGFMITGIPNPVLWGVVAMILSLIPGVGTSLVTVPGILYLFFSAPLWHGILLAVWAIFGIGLIDNLLSPYVMKRGMNIHPLLILLSALGGISFFGPIGFILGPIVLAFFFALLDIYPRIITNE